VKAISRTSLMAVLLAAFSVATAQMITVATEGYTSVNSPEDWRGPGRRFTSGPAPACGWGRIVWFG
jgi:hypothetical protein